MKTTLDIPDEILIAAKREAALQRKTLRDVVTASLRQSLGLTTPKGKKPLRWVTVAGPLPFEVESREDMHAGLRPRKR